MNRHDARRTRDDGDDLDARLTAALHRRAADVSLAPRGIGDVRRRVQRRRRRAATVGAAAVSVPALAGIAWLASNQDAGSTVGSPPADSLDGLAPTTTGQDQISWRCAGPLGEDGGYAYYQQCELVDPGVVPVLTTTVEYGPATTMPYVLGTFPPMTTTAVEWVGTILIVDATGTTVDGSTVPGELLVQSLTAAGSPYVYEVLTANRTSPETMVMPVATDFDSTTNAAVIAGYLGVGGYDTWDPANWTSGATIPGDLTMVVVLGGDWASRLVGPVLPEPTTTTEYLPPDQAIQTTTIGCLIGTYTVVEGDAPSTVAAKLDVTLQDLVLANEDNPDFASFFVGAVINVPDLAC